MRYRQLSPQEIEALREDMRQSSDGDRVWLLDATGKRLCDMTAMQLLDLGSRISVESGLLNFDLEAQKWRG